MGHIFNRDTTATLSREARAWADTLSRKLEQLNICYRYKRNEKDWMERGTQRVKFNLAITQDEAVWLRIDTSPRGFPRGISLSHIDNPEILGDLGVAIGRPVRFRREEDGAWLIIERQSGVFGIRAVDFSEVMADERWQELSPKPLYLPLGMGHNRRLVYRSLCDFPHVLVGGATMSGKTTLLHAWICALILKNTPRLLRLLLIDLKGGVEFTRYKNLPHLWKGGEGDTLSGFIKRREDVVPVLELVRAEMDRRLMMFEQASSQNIAAWNHRHRNAPLPRLVIFIDELASIMLEPDLKKDAERLLADIGARGRAPGIHLIVATQRPEVSVVSGRIKGNLDARCGFRVPDNTSSMVILDDISAAQFPESTPRGRYIYKFGNDRRELQGPWIDAHKIKSIVDNVIAGDVGAQIEAVRHDPMDIFRAALSKRKGDLAVHPLYQLLRGQFSRGYIERTLAAYEGELIELDGELYEIFRPDAQFSARRMVRVHDTPVDAMPPDGDGGMDGVTHRVTQTLPMLTQEVTQETQRVTQEASGADSRTPLAWLRWAVYHNNGDMPVRKLYAQFKDDSGLSYQEFAEVLKEYEQTSVEIDGVLYFCEPGTGKSPRRLVKV